ncbi:MAG: hypothetical protein JWN40_269 [Phycisphaerales bacterium]|nr:hypothetical protein [Phycisphaerales bacterium]
MRRKTRAATTATIHLVHYFSRSILALLTLTAAAPFAQADGARAEVSFRNDVMAVISKAGCNAGACHGNKTGKGGFKLSLRGQDPDLDYAALTHDLFARRTNAIDPDRSLILLKATAQIAHEGGQRFRTDSLEYNIFRRWIETGTPPDGAGTPTLVRLEVSPAQQVLVEPAEGVTIKALAVFSDGSRRDVSNLAVYEQSADLAKISADGVVRRLRMGETTVIVRFLQMQQPVRLAFVPARPDFAWTPVASANYIDDQVLAKLRMLRINQSDPANDLEFLRRAYLDLIGVLPTVAEAKTFLADATIDKRSRLIDRLFDRPEYADQWAMKWSDLLRNEERALDRKGVQNFHHWIRQGIAQNKPLDQFVRELLAARGSTYTSPATNYYRANRDPVVRGEATAQLFLGVRLQCAQCHNHPFDRWTQDDYYGWADVFARVDYKVLENRRGDKNDKHEFVGEQIVYEAREGDVKDPRGDRSVKPLLLGAGTEVSNDASRIDALANWVTSPANPFFAKAQVNRIWFHLMGRGLVDPVDDFRPTNPASHPELLDALAKDFVAHKYDVRYMIRLIMSSQAYGLSSEPNATNADDEINYSHAIPRRLTAEQLLDAQHQVTGVPAEFNGYPRGMRAGEIPGVRVTKARKSRPSQADMFLVTFGKPARELVCECERSMDTTLGQAFQLISGPEIASLLADSDNRLTQLIKSGKTDGEAVAEL